jgi:hypothetical protein
MEDLEQFREKRWDKLVNDFISNQSEEFESFCERKYEAYKREWLEAQADDYRHEGYDRERDDEATEIIQTDAELGREYEQGKL